MIGLIINHLTAGLTGNRGVWLWATLLLIFSSVAVGASNNISPFYSAITFSSQNTKDGQLAAKAVDGVVDGWPGDYTKEWATVGGKAGSWIRLDWSSAYTVDHVVLYDRPNLNDQVLSGTLLFSDGTSVPVGSLPDDGTGLTVTFGSRTVTWVRFTVNTVKSTTFNIGLAELQVFGDVGGGTNTAPTITTGPTATPSDIGEDQTSQLSVTASDPDGDVLTYLWQPASGTITGSGASVTFNPPAVTADTLVRINLTVSDPGGLSATGYVDVMVRNVGGGSSSNISPFYSAITFSSQNTKDGQLAAKAVDGVVDGWPGDYTKEWATVGGKAGSWIRLDWSSAYTVDHVVLYDRPNLNDQVLSGTLLFSDGTSVPVGSLPDDGTGLTVTFGSRTVTWVRFTVNTVKSTTFNIGLAELQVFGDVGGGTNTAPTITTGPTATPSDIGEDQTSQLSVTASDPDGDVLTYLWQPASGTITGSGASVTFNPPAVTADTLVRINLTVSDPGGLSATGYVDVMVRNVGGGSSSNISPFYSAITFSSQNTKDGQLAAKAVDGVVDGWPGDYTKEWATVGGKAGSWIRLDWSSAYTVDHVVLYDRPNLNDQVLSGTLLFSDGTSVPVGSLPDDGTGLTVTFGSRTVTWVRFTVNTVKSTTFNIGLAEMEVYTESAPELPAYYSHYWQLDGTGSVYSDTAVAGVDATCTNCPTATSGNIGGAQQFNGVTTELNAIDSDTVEWGANDSFTIKFWLQKSSACAEQEAVVGRKDLSGSMEWWVGCAGGNAAFLLTDNAGASVMLNGTSNIDDGVWHHITAVRDGFLGVNRLYVDGVLEASSQIDYIADFSGASTDINIGWLNDGASYYHFDGAVDELALMTRVPSQDEINRDYNDGTVGLGIGYWGYGSRVQIMPLGDSITVGSHSEATGGYRGLLISNLGQGGYDFTFVGSQSDIVSDHEGHSGYTPTDISSFLASWLTSNHPEVILLHIGTNGLVSSDPSGVENILNIIHDFDANITVVLARIINMATYDALTTEFNDNVVAMAQNRIAAGYKIIVVDMESALDYAVDMSDDGLHPNTAGYSKMAGVWGNGLHSFMPASIPVAPTISSSPLLSAAIGTNYSYQVRSDSYPLPQYSLTTAPAGMTIHPYTGEINWSAPVFGSYDVSVSVSNGVGTATQSYTIQAQ